jgi:enamine deaminase RidA (YjgF/YER057c/UK114 family)
MFIAGQVAVNADGELVGADDFAAQAAQVFKNLGVALKSAGAGYANIVQFTTYLVDSRDIPKLREFRERHYAQFFPDGKFPPNTLLIVDRLVREELLIEIAAIAAL